MNRSVPSVRASRNPRPHRFPVARRMLRYARPYRGWLGLALLLILLTALATNTLPLLIRHATDAYLVDAPGRWTPAARVAGLTRTALWYLALGVAAFLLHFVQGVLTAWIGQRIIVDLRMAVFEKTLRLSLGVIDRRPIGHWMTRVTSDVEALQRFVTEGVVGTAADLCMLVGVVGFMLVLSPLLAATVLCVLPILFGLLFYVNRRLRNANRAIRDRTAALNATLQESLSGMDTIQLFNREATVRRGFGRRSGRLRRAHLEEVRWFSLYFPVLELFQAVTVVLILVVGAMAMFRGSAAVSLGVLVAFLSYVRSFFNPLGSLSDKAGTFQQAAAAAERLFAVLDTAETVRDPSRPLRPGRVRGAIEFADVDFAYDPPQDILHGVSFAVAPGETLAVVGATGAGKSSLINLLARFYDVRRGQVRIDGHDVREFAQRDLRVRMGIVPQDPFVFAATVLENIRLFDPAIAPGRVVAAARAVNAHGFIAALPDGYETRLNERGSNLSQGQKQLLALARALAHDPEALFVLDEATASVDAETEALIQAGLQALARHRTSILIAHRLSTIRHADRILVMKDGRRVALGSHAELMAERGYYWRLHHYMAQQTA